MHAECAPSIAYKKASRTCGPTYSPWTPINNYSGQHNGPNALQVQMGAGLGIAAAAGAGATGFGSVARTGGEAEA